MHTKHRIRYILQQMIHRYFTDGIAQSSAELAYFLLFSFFPILMFVNSILARINISPETLITAIQILPLAVQSMIISYFEHISETPSISPLVIGITLTLYFMSRSVRSIIRTTNRIYRVEQRAGGIYQVLISVLFTAGFLLTIVASFVLVIAGRTLVRMISVWIAVPVPLTRLAGLGGQFIVAVFIFMFLMVYNYVVPNIKLHWKNVMPGSVFSLIIWFGMSVGFSFYVDNMARYSLLYGSLGAMIILMLWLYLTGIVLLLGTQLNHIIYVMRHATGQGFFIDSFKDNKNLTGEDIKHEGSSN